MAWNCPVCGGKLKQLRGKNIIVPFFITENQVCTNCIGIDNKILEIEPLTELRIKNGTPEQMKMSGNITGYINAMNNFIARHIN